MKVYELETKNGRVWRVVVANDNQEKRLLKLVQHNKNHKSYETFTRVECVLNGIHDIKSFTDICRNLV